MFGLTGKANCSQTSTTCANLILSGRPYNHLERERIQRIRLAARQSFQQASDQSTLSAEAWAEWADQQLDALPAMYLMNQQPARIARDLAVIQQLPELKVHIEGGFEPETEMVTYRAFATERCAAGSFHHIAGIFSGMGIDIREAFVCTSTQGFVIASFRGADRNFIGLVPESRIEDIVGIIADVLLAKRHPDTAFRRSSILQLNRLRGITIRQDPKVAIDNDCSQRYTVIDVFATDIQGLLYTLSSALNSLDSPFTSRASIPAWIRSSTSSMCSMNSAEKLSLPKELKSFDTPCSKRFDGSPTTTEPRHARRITRTQPAAANT
jgi:[protein-PII] uridylyltransferase